jgi:TolB protein
MDADGSNVVRLTHEGKLNAAPAWSPDGRSIAFSSLRDGQWGIYVMDLDGDLSKPKSVGYDAGYQVDPAWSPDGKTIAFTSDARAYDFLFDIYVTDPDHSNVRLLVNGPFFWVDGLKFFFQPAWSPDGTRLAMVRCVWSWDKCFPESTIVIANADGSGLTTLVGTAGNARPAWSPDGTMIAYSYQLCREQCESSIRYTTSDGRTGGLILQGGRSPTWKR